MGQAWPSFPLLGHLSHVHLGWHLQVTLSVCQHRGPQRRFPASWDSLSDPLGFQAAPAVPPSLPAVFTCSGLVGGTEGMLHLRRVSEWGLLQMLRVCFLSHLTPHS